MATDIKSKEEIVLEDNELVCILSVLPLMRYYRTNCN